MFIPAQRSHFRQAVQAPFIPLNEQSHQAHEALHTMEYIA